MKNLIGSALLLLVGLNVAQADQAIFAGGCFWCVEADFEKLDGVSEVVSGYIGGEIENPNYKQVSSGRTRHVEAVRIEFDPAKVSYAQLLDHLWVNIDPTVDDRQFCDTGRHYRPAIFAIDEAQRETALASRQAIIDAGKVAPIKVPVETAGRFWDAEDYHQDYYKKNPIRYQFYRTGCGRDRRLAELWGEQAGGH